MRDASEAKAHGQVHGFHILGHRTDGNVIDTRFGNHSKGILVDAAAGFQTGTACG